jgi:hypothetical protein
MGAGEDVDRSFVDEVDRRVAGNRGGIVDRGAAARRGGPKNGWIRIGTLLEPAGIGVGTRPEIIEMVAARARVDIFAMRHAAVSIGDR